MIGRTLDIAPPTGATAPDRSSRCCDTINGTLEAEAEAPRKRHAVTWALALYLSCSSPTSVTATDARQGRAPRNPVTHALTGTREFAVGPGRHYAELDAVPWAKLGPGDVVNIHARAKPYVSKFGLRARGTATAKVVINGVTDAQGNRPVISFAGARTAPGSAAVFAKEPAYGESLGGIVIKRGPGDDYLGPKPSFIEIRNLEVHGARGSYTTVAGGTANYGSAACIYVHVGSDILIENVVAHDCAFGIFTMAKDEMLSQAVERITVRNSRVFDNGVPGSWLEHNLYIQADSPVIEGNFIGRLKAGSHGSSFKDRSARLVFRHNYVESSARALDLVHSEEQSQGIAALPHYGTDYVCGNTIVNDSAGAAIHYGGDNLGEQEAGERILAPALPYRRHLYFWDNDVQETVSGWRNSVFDLSLVGTTVEAWNNRFTFGAQARTHYWLEWAGVLRLGPNQVTGRVVASGRDGANAAHWSIATGISPPSDPFLSGLR